MENGEKIFCVEIKHSAAILNLECVEKWVYFKNKLRYKFFFAVVA